MSQCVPTLAALFLASVEGFSIEAPKIAFLIISGLISMSESSFSDASLAAHDSDSSSLSPFSWILANTGRVLVAGVYDPTKAAWDLV